MLLAGCGGGSKPIAYRLNVQVAAPKERPVKPREVVVDGREGGVVTGIAEKMKPFVGRIAIVRIGLFAGYAPVHIDATALVCGPRMYLTLGHGDRPPVPSGGYLSVGNATNADAGDRPITRFVAIVPGRPPPSRLPVTEDGRRIGTATRHRGIPSVFDVVLAAPQRIYVDQPLAYARGALVLLRGGTGRCLLREGGRL